MSTWSCGRCGGKNTSYQGHYSRGCHVINRIENRKGIDAHLDHPFHFCCPDDCELFEQDGAPKPISEETAS